jgi:hypothetical protein
MPDVGNWWRSECAAPFDRLLCGIAEMRLIVVSPATALIQIHGVTQLIVAGESI